MRPGQAVMGLIAEQTTGVAAIAAITLAGTNALGSLHLPEPPRAPTAAQAQGALRGASERRALIPGSPARGGGGACSTVDAEYEYAARC
jgi:hypothetical protein